MEIALTPGTHLWLPREVDALPIGSTVGQWADLHYLYRKVNENGWERTGHVQTYRNGATQDVRRDVEGSPGAFAVHSRPDLPAMNLAQTKWLLRQVIMSSIYGHGRGEREGTAAIQALHLRFQDLDLPFGTDQIVTYQADLQHLPERSVIRFGHPDHFRRFGMFVRIGDRWERLVGTANGPGNPTTISQYVVVTVGGEEVRPAWMNTGPADEAEQEAIRALRADAWRHAAAAKNRNGWCGTLENVMLGAGVTAASLQEAARVGDYPVGRSIQANQSMGLPVGTILFWAHPDAPETRWAYYVRDANATNLAGTRLLFGSRDDQVALRSSQHSMRVAAYPAVNPDDRYHLRLAPSWEVVKRLLPPGTIFKREDGGMGEVYQVTTAGTIHGPTPRRDVHNGGIEARGNYEWDAFTGEHWRVVRFPGVRTHMPAAEVAAATANMANITITAAATTATATQVQAAEAFA